MAEYEASDPDRVKYRIRGPEGASDAEVIARIQEWLGTPAGRVDQAFNDLRNRRDPKSGQSRLAQTLEAGDTNFGSPEANAAGAALATSPLWGPTAGRTALQYGVPTAVGAGLAHLDLPPWIHELARDFILGRLLGLGKK